MLTPYTTNLKLLKRTLEKRLKRLEALPEPPPWAGPAVTSPC